MKPIHPDMMLGPIIVPTEKRDKRDDQATTSWYLCERRGKLFLWCWAVAPTLRWKIPQFALENSSIFRKLRNLMHAGRSVEDLRSSSCHASALTDVDSSEHFKSQTSRRKSD
jgi:hypothetical protein